MDPSAPDQTTSGRLRRPTRAEQSLAALNKISLAVLRGERTPETVLMVVRSACRVFDGESAALVTAPGDFGCTSTGTAGLHRSQYLTSAPDQYLLDRNLAVVVPIASGRHSFGQLAITRPDLPFSTEDALAIEGFASAAAQILAAGQERIQAESRMREVAAQLQTALESRVVIEQAKGIIAAVRNIDVEDAFDRLRKHSRSHNANIHEIASAVVRRRLLP